MVNLLEEVSYQEVRPKMAKCSLILPDFLTIDSEFRIFHRKNLGIASQVPAGILLCVANVIDVNGAIPEQLR